MPDRKQTDATRTDTTPTETTDSSETEPPSRLGWIIPLCTATAAIAYAAARLPARAKLLGLLPAAIGLLVGCVSGSLAPASFRRSPAVLIVTTSLVAAVAVVGSTVASHRAWASEVRADLERQLRERREATPTSLTSPLALESQRRTFDEATSFGSFLERRTSQLGWPRWAAIVLWVSEVLVSSVVAGVVAWRLVRPGLPPSSELRRARSP